MKRQGILILFLTIFLSLNAYSQCENCPETGKKSDYCFSDENFPERCAFFVKDSKEFTYTYKKKVYTLPVPEKDTPTAYKKLLEANKKLKSEDLLFLWEALARWRKEEIKIGFEFTSSGLGYRIIKEGNGKNPKNGDRVEVHYRGYLEDGKEFDNSYKRGRPFEFPVGQGKVIKGWDEGVKLFKEGGKGTLMIPPELGYGARGVPGVIPPNATLFFDIEIIKIK